MLNLVLFGYSSLRLETDAVYKALEQSLYTKEKLMFAFVFDESLSCVEVQTNSYLFLNNALISLKNIIKKYFDADIVIVKADTMSFLLSLANQYGELKVYTSVIYEDKYLTFYKTIDKTISNNKNLKVAINYYNDSLIFTPKKILNNSGEPFKVFTHFYNHIKNKNLTNKVEAIDFSKYKNVAFVSSELPFGKMLQADNNFIAYKDCYDSCSNTLRDFLNNKLLTYKNKRDYFSLENTSLMSRYLRFGIVSPLKVLDEALKVLTLNNQLEDDNFIKEIIWREFAYYILYHYPYITTKDFKANVYKNFIWENEKLFIDKFESGKTGYPLIDAGINQLISTGNMHNRVRMCVASFFVKNLQIPWQIGAKFFMKHLIDADMVINSFSWQWVAGCGVDSAQYFRIFNPLLQNKKFDENCEYIKKYLPNLSHLSNKEIFQLYESDSNIVDFKKSRKLFLEKIKL